MYVWMCFCIYTWNTYIKVNIVHKNVRVVDVYSLVWVSEWYCHFLLTQWINEGEWKRDILSFLSLPLPFSLSSFLLSLLRNSRDFLWFSSKLWTHSMWSEWRRYIICVSCFNIQYMDYGLWLHIKTTSKLWWRSLDKINDDGSLTLWKLGRWQQYRC